MLHRLLGKAFVRRFTFILVLVGSTLMARGQAESRVFIRGWNASNQYTDYSPAAAAGRLLGNATQTNNWNATWAASWDVDPANGRLTFRENGYTNNPGNFSLVQGGAILIDTFTVLAGNSGLADGAAVNVNVDVRFTGFSYTTNIPSGSDGTAYLTLSAGQVIGTGWIRPSPVQLQHDSYDPAVKNFNVVTGLTIATTVGASFQVAMGIGSDLFSAAGTQVSGATQPGRDVGFEANSAWTLTPNIAGVVVSSAAGFSPVPEPANVAWMVGSFSLLTVGLRRPRRI